MLLHKPSFFATLGLSAIIIASTGYSFLIVNSSPGSIIIPITAIVSVCILLGMAQIILGYEIRSLRNLAIGRNLVPGSAAGVAESRGSSRYPPIIIGNESHFDDFKNAPDPAKMDESDKRLEKFRQALKRMGRPIEYVAPRAEKKRVVAGTRTKRVDLRRNDDGMDKALTKSFHVSMVGRTEIVLLATSTGEEVKLPVGNAEVLEMAWQAFAKGMRVRPIIQSGRLARLEPG